MSYLLKELYLPVSGDFWSFGTENIKFVITEKFYYRTFRLGNILFVFRVLRRENRGREIQKFLREFLRDAGFLA